MQFDKQFGICSSGISHFSSVPYYRNWIEEEMKASKFCKNDWSSIIIEIEILGQITIAQALWFPLLVLLPSHSLLFPDEEQIFLYFTSGRLGLDQTTGLGLYISPGITFLLSYLARYSKNAGNMECVGVMEPSECCNCIFQLTSITRTPLVSCPLEGELVEQSEAHVVIFLRLWLRLLGSGSRGRSSLASGSSSSSGSRGTSGRNGAELLCPLLVKLPCRPTRRPKETVRPQLLPRPHRTLLDQRPVRGFVEMFNVYINSNSEQQFFYRKKSGDRNTNPTFLWHSV